ncbi:MAG: SDR family NAD(P)-dependent oxidoreductase [Pseudomonadota bacterium]
MTEEKKIAVVAGASRGLGFETSRQLARSGIRVILIAKTQPLF